MALINAVYHKYGDCLCLENADRDLLDTDAYYIKAGGAVVVLDDTGHVRGTHAMLPEATRAKVCIFRRLYLEAALRGVPWGAQLMQWTIVWAHAHSMHRVEFWSDTRFTQAHVFFARFGFQCEGRLWSMDDGCIQYQEYFFFLNL